jgi:flagellar basal-body rod protein FlgB
VDAVFRPEALDLYEKMLDFTARRHRVIANNIANINTPGFRRAELEFADELKQALRGRGFGSVKALGFRVTQPDATAVRNDGNNVSIDQEMAALAENAILYQVYAQLLARRFRGLQDMLKEA